MFGLEESLLIAEVFDDADSLLAKLDSIDVEFSSLDDTLTMSFEGDIEVLLSLNEFLTDEETEPSLVGDEERDSPRHATRLDIITIIVPTTKYFFITLLISSIFFSFSSRNMSVAFTEACQMWDVAYSRHLFY